MTDRLVHHQQLCDSIRAFMQRWPGPSRADEAEFNAFARSLFSWQYHLIEPYRRLCDQRGVTPDTWDGDWRTIPAVPTEAFKHHHLFAWDPEDAYATFRTSGTTTGELRGQHHFKQLATYEASAWSWFQSCVLPDAPTGLVPIYLALSPAEVPESSLGHMLGMIAEQLGPTADPFFLALEGVATEALEEDLTRCCEAGQPVLLFTTSYALAWWLERSKWLTPLPPGSRVVETGGFKGFVARFSSSELTLVARHRLGIESAYWLAEYGMTELSSQLYSSSLRASVLHDVPATGLIAPPWLQVRVVDPTTGEDLPPQTTGLIQFFDLANVDSVSAIYTQDLGQITKDGTLILEGRVKDAPARGCSLTALELLGPIPQTY